MTLTSQSHMTSSRG